MGAVLSNRRKRTRSNSHSGSTKRGAEVNDQSEPTSASSMPISITTRASRSNSLQMKVSETPYQTGRIKFFSADKGYGFITADRTGEDYFVHISDIEGEYVPVPGDEVNFKLCPIPPKYEKIQAILVKITHLEPDIHKKWHDTASVEYYLQFQKKKHLQ